MSKAHLKLPRLPERTQIRLTFTVSPDLHRKLEAYADAYEQIYGQRESIATLIPSILEHFIASDRAFLQAQKG
jgi:hypothetical protein